MERGTKTQACKKKSMNVQQTLWKSFSAQRSCTQEFEGIIKSRKSDIIWLAYYQSKIF